MALLSEVIATEPTANGHPSVEKGRAQVGNKRLTVLLLAGIVLVAIAMRGYRLSARSFWFDEAFCWRLIQFPFAELLDGVARDNPPPLYFIRLRGWAAVFGTSAFALRSLSVLLGGLTVAGMYLFVTEAFRGRGKVEDGQGERRARRVGLVVAALVALSAFQIRWSWEVRMYALGTTLAAFSIWALFRALQAPAAAWRPWFWYGFLTLLFVYAHYYALFSVAAQAVFILGYLLVRARGNPVAVLRGPLCGRAALAAGV